MITRIEAKSEILHDPYFPLKLDNFDMVFVPGILHNSSHSMAFSKTEWPLYVILYRRLYRNQVK